MQIRNASNNGDNFTFEKVLQKTSFVAMTVPSSFVQAHADEFSGISWLRYDGATTDWKVKVKVYIMNTGYLHISIATGFKQFCRAHNLKVGDRLQFHLFTKNHFNITRINSAPPSRPLLAEVGNN